MEGAVKFWCRSFWWLVRCVAAIATWAMNSALLANPITWVIVAIVALVAAVVVICTRSLRGSKTIIDVILGRVSEPCSAGL